MTKNLDDSWRGRYVDESFMGKLKRRLGKRDGHQICCDCKRPFFNLIKSEICYDCWSKPSSGYVCKLCGSEEHNVADCPIIGGPTIRQRDG
jgi:hypothetical protein